jgi:glycerol-3-phosphate O-acyltransferase
LAELNGRPKKSESLAGLIGAVRLLRRNFGKVHVNFGQPVPLAELLDARHPSWREDEFDVQAPWLRQAVDATATTLAADINAVAVVNPVNLVALTLLSTPKHAADLRCWRARSSTSSTCSPIRPGPKHRPLPQPAEAVIDYVIGLDMVQRHAHPLGDMVRADEAQAALLAYFRNNVLHLLALPALLACLVSHNQSLTRQRARQAIHGIYGLLGADLFLPWRDVRTGCGDRSRRGFAAGRGLILVEDGGSCARRRPTARPARSCASLARSSAPRWSASSSRWRCCSTAAAAS